MQSRMMKGAGGWALASALALLVMAAAPASNDGVALVANSSVSDSALSTQDAQDVFLGKKTVWSDGSKITLAVLSGGDVHDTFLSSIIERTASQFVTHWKKLVFTGKAMEPKSFATEAELLKFVAANKGAVGYVAAKTADNKDAMAGCKALAK